MKAAAVVVACLLTFVLPPASAAQATLPDLAKAETLLKEGRAAEAYALLQPSEIEAAGDPDYDYLLGVAALESGRPDKASIALERALIVNPDFVGARLDLARAYFALGDLDRARLEFRTVLEQDPPPGAKDTVDRYLAEIDARVIQQRRRWTAYLEGTVGYDSNVNASTSSSTVFVPLFGLTLNLASTNVKGSSNYLTVGAGGEYIVPVSDALSVFTGLDLRYRMHSRNEEYEYSRIDGRVGLQYTSGQNLYRASVNHGRFYLDHRYNYTLTGGTVEWRRALGDRDAATLIAQHNQLRFPDPALEANDVDQTILGAGWAHSYNAQNTTFVFAGAHVGNEDDRKNRVDGERRLTGIRFLGQYSFNPAWEGYIALSAQVSDYRTENFVFATTRNDKLYEAAIGAVWHLDRNWSVRPQLVYARNKSNILINDYDRYDVSVTLRRDFR